MKEKILYSDDKAAKQTTISGWLSSNGRFFTDENIARYDGCTHVVCQECKGDCEKPYYVCRACREKKDKDKYLAKPFKEWDQTTPLVIYGTDIFFFEIDIDGEILDYCQDNEIDVKDLELVICEPVYLPELDYLDFFHDELPDDGELCDEVIEAFEELNKVIRKQSAASWVEGKYRTSIKD